MRVVIRTDASLRIGTGHVMRCLTLARALHEKGAEVVFICRDHTGNLINKIQSEGFEVYTLITKSNFHSAQSREPLQPTLAHAEWLGASQRQDAKGCQPILEKNNPDWLIVDHYAIDQVWQKALKPYYQKLMVIDDLGDREHICDLLLDQNFGSTREKYQNLVPTNCCILAGSDYTLLRPEFAQWRDYSLKRRQQPVLKNLLINLGGVDADNYTGKVLNVIRDSTLPKDIQIKVVMGALAPHLEEVKKIANRMPFETIMLIDVNNMAEVMANSDLAIGAAGSTTWERCCLGLPAIQLVIAENQRLIANALVKENVIKLADKPEQINGFIDNVNSWLYKLSFESRQIVNGHGAEQIIKCLIEYENNDT